MRPASRFWWAPTTSPSPKTFTSGFAGAECRLSSLNAKNDEEEAKVIAEAGKLGAVTVSTQMAGPRNRYPARRLRAADDSAEKAEVADPVGCT